MVKPSKQSYNRTMTSFRESKLYPELKQYCLDNSLRINEVILEAIDSWSPYKKWAKNRYPSKKVPAPNEGLREYCFANGLKQLFALEQAVGEFIK